jgi:hypothetical protein
LHGLHQEWNLSTICSGTCVTEHLEGLLFLDDEQNLGCLSDENLLRLQYRCVAWEPIADKRGTGTDAELRLQCTQIDRITNCFLPREDLTGDFLPKCKLDPEIDSHARLNGFLMLRMPILIANHPRSGHETSSSVLQCRSDALYISLGKPSSSSPSFQS